MAFAGAREKAAGGARIIRFVFVLGFIIEIGGNDGWNNAGGGQA